MNSSSSPVSGASTTENMASEDSRPHVLIVDGDAFGRNFLREIFRKYSRKVSTVENGLQALRLLGLVDDPQRSGNDPIPKVNLVIMDYDTPAGMTGYELVKKIKESSATKDATVVFVSSVDDMPSESDKCLKAGAHMFINKLFINVFVESLTKKAMT